MIARNGLVAVALIVAMNGAAMAQNWVQIADNDKYTLSIDPYTIKVVSPTIRSAWFLFNEKKPLAGVQSYKELDRLDCENEATAVVSRTLYGAGDDVISSKTTPIASLEYAPAPPGTVATLMVKMGCLKPAK